MASWGIVESELIEWLGSYGGPRYHAVLSDPPYALISITKRFGKAGSAPAREGSDGRYSRLSGGFMGQKWDGFESLEHYQKWVSEWSELMIQRLLYPGAVCLFFGGTRTFHHLGVGLENGGFEIVDSILIPWITGQGFPKSHSYTKAILDSFLRVSLQGGVHSRRTTGDSEDDYSCLLCDGPLRDALVIVREVEPSQDDVQAHIRPSSPSVEIQADNGRIHKVSFGALSFHHAKPDCLPLKTWLTILLASLESTGSLQREMPQFDTMAALGIPAAVLSRDLNLNERDSSSGGDSFLPNIDAFEKVFRKHDNSTLPMFRKDSLTSYSYLTKCCKACQRRYSREFVDWRGRGTHLKPAWEPVFVCRAPRRGFTFAQLAEEFGTGALNIDGSRIGGTAGDGRWGKGIQKEKRNIVSNEPELDSDDERIVSHASGRWPANFALSHNDDCMKVGEYLVDGRTLNRYPSHGAGGSFAFYSEDHRGEEYDSEETPPDLVERWACVPGCAVRGLDDQAGNLKSGDNAVRTKRAEGVVYGGGVGMEQEPTGESELTYGDSGGPSRFFYTSKASKGEKDKGLENFYWFRGNEGFERITRDAYEKLDPEKRAHGNVHPTCKPLELLRYLATLVLPPQQEGCARRILVPFSGSGSEVIAAIQSGWDEVTGVEMMSIYNEMAEARLRGSIGMF